MANLISFAMRASTDVPAPLARPGGCRAQASRAAGFVKLKYPLPGIKILDLFCRGIVTGKVLCCVVTRTAV